ncbi:MAG TPA: hypothetical protein VIG64_07020 [Actinomycetota bacterium]
MADFNLEESRKLAVLIARTWADPALAERYRNSPGDVLAGAGIDLAGRAAPDLPGRPVSLDVKGTENIPEFSSASSFSTVSCPCTACTASCAGPGLVQEMPASAILRLAEDPEGRAAARKMAESWGVKIDIHP